MTKAKISAGQIFGLILALLGLCGGLASPASAQTTPGWQFTGNLSTNRFGHTATLLQNGKVLVVGGGGFPCDVRFCFATVNDTAELYDPATGAWSRTGSPGLRTGHTATLLKDGQVLVAGGFGFEHLRTAELYDPATGRWRATASFNQIIGGHVAALLPDGRVLAVGRTNPNGGLVDSAELYDPATGQWSNTAAPPGTRFLGPMTVLPNGKVLLMGANTAELYDPAAGAWSSAGSLDIYGPYTVTPLPNGKVLVTGYDVAGLAARLYDPVAGTWRSTGHFNEAHNSGTATLLADGRVLVAGGTNDFNTIGSAEIYDPAAGTWDFTSRLNARRFLHTATLLPDGRVLITGGVDGDFDFGTVYYDSAELYTPSAGPNPIDDAEFFVRQHYRDFLGREPEQGGLDAWLRVLHNCAGGDGECQHQARLTTSASFFNSPEFQLKGYYVFRFYKVAFGLLPRYDEIIPDMQSVSGGTPAEVYARKAAFADAFAGRPAFVNRYARLSNDNYVAGLLFRYELDAITTPDPAAPDGAAKVTLTRAELVARLDDHRLTRAQVLRAVADSDEVVQLEFNRAFVAMQYYGYLRRTPEEGGYNAWLNYLNAHPEDFREMVRGFVDSTEYRRRFGRP